MKEKKILSEYHRKNRKLICIKNFFLGKQNLPTSTLNVIIKNLWVWKVLGCNRLQPLRKFKFRGEKATIKQLAFKAHRLVWLEDSDSIAEQGGDSPLEWALGGPCTLSFLCLLSVLWTWLSHLDTNLTPKCTACCPLFEDQKLCVHETFSVGSTGKKQAFKT